MTEKRLSHAYMLVGPEDEARREAAARLTAALLCSEADAPCGRCRDCKKVFAGVHPDVISVERQAGDKGQLHREILVDQIRRIVSDAYIAPNEAARKVYVIPEADRLGVPAQNALLKALEDPPGHACFLLCAAAPDALLPTVRSRCVRTDGERRDLAQPPLSDAAREYIRLAAQGDTADVTLFCMLRTRLSREDADALLDEILEALCGILCARRENPGLSPADILRLTALLERAREHLARNVSPKQIFGLLAAETIQR